MRLDCVRLMGGCECVVEVRGDREDVMWNICRKWVGDAAADDDDVHQHRHRRRRPHCRRHHHHQGRHHKPQHPYQGGGRYGRNDGRGLRHQHG